jgi:hypothetical protein
MTSTWTTAVEAAADTLGEILMAMADGRDEPTTEAIAASVLRSGLAVLLQAPPELERVQEVARVLWGKLHNDDDAPWASLTPAETAFWIDLAANATITADLALLNETSDVIV